MLLKIRLISSLGRFQRVLLKNCTRRNGMFHNKHTELTCWSADTHAEQEVYTYEIAFREIMLQTAFKKINKHEKTNKQTMVLICFYMCYKIPPKAANLFMLPKHFMFRRCNSNTCLGKDGSHLDHW